MKMTPLYDKARKNMEPGVIVQSGFLGDDTRPLTDIIQRDEELMKSQGTSFDDAVKKMKHLMEEGKKGLGDPIRVDDTWRVTIQEARGRLPSPFEDGIFKKISATVENIKTKRRIVYSELSLHLIETYHFLQGKGAPYRLEPKDIKEVLEL